MKFVKTDLLSESTKDELLDLWNREYPEELIFTRKEFRDYLDKLSEVSHILLMDDQESIKGWYLDFMRDGEKWFVIILDSSLQGQGWGSRMMDEAKKKEDELNGWIVDHNHFRKQSGEFYQSPLTFYEKNGFRKLPEQTLKTEKINAVKIQWKKALA